MPKPLTSTTRQLFQNRTKSTTNTWVSRIYIARIHINELIALPAPMAMAYALATTLTIEGIGRLQAELMRKIDRWIGVPICFALTVWERLRSLLVRGGDTKVPPESILLIQLAEMGGWVVAQGAIKRLSRIYPDAHIHFLTFSRSRELLELMGRDTRGEIVTIGTDSLRIFARDSLRALRRLRGLGIQATINLETFARFSTIVAYLCGARSRVGFHPMSQDGPYVGDLVTHKVLYNPHIHAGRSFLTLAEALAEPIDQEPHAKLDLRSADLAIIPLGSDEAEEKHMRATLVDAMGCDPSTKRLVVLNTNASDMVPNRRWPMSSFAFVAHDLLCEPAIAVVLIGTPDEYMQNQKLVQALGSDRLTNLAGRTSLPQLLALLRMSSLLITNDSGPGHFAGLTNTPALVLFGPETPRIFGPLGAEAKTVYLSLACSPCISAYNQKNSPCRDNRCLKEITPRQVLDLAREMLVCEEATAGSTRDV